jgi:hypothetical protein
VTLFDSADLRPPSKLRRYLIWTAAVIVTIVVFVAVFPSYLWYPFVYYKEVNAARHLMDAVTAGDMQRAYQLWKPAPSYSFQDFLEDWGPEGFYGPVKSYRLGRPEQMKNSTATDISVEVSPYQPFPGDDPVKMVKSKTVHLWVDFRNQSISFPAD